MEIGENRFRPGPAKAGYQAGFVLRFNLTRRLHLQSELNFAFVNYSIRAEGSAPAAVRNPAAAGSPVRAPAALRRRPVPRGRLRAGQRPKLLKVNFNDDVGIMGGVGFNIRKFFFDFRLSGYARSHVWNTFVSDGVSQRVRIPRNLVYGGSVGFFF
ncbi:MAG: PorT family protein [Alistipes finegoldii]